LKQIKLTGNLETIDPPLGQGQGLTSLATFAL